MARNPRAIFEVTIEFAIEFANERSAIDSERTSDSIISEIFRALLLSYEGYDLFEVVCREAGYVTIKHWLEENGCERIKPQDASYLLSAYKAAVIEAAEKYVISDDWPRVERERVASIVAKARGYWL